ncbi:hypothetical protein WN943_014433 [Citrus x changshan-huyou]
MEVAGDKYRSILNDEAKSMQWRHSGPLIFDKVNKLFEEGRTKEWPGGSIEETIQNVVRSWEMELSHKTSLNDFKTTNPEKFKLIVNAELFAGLFKRPVLTPIAETQQNKSADTSTSHHCPFYE